MVQQFTIINKEKLLKGDLAVWANVIQSAFRKVYMGRCDYGAISSDENPTKLEKQGPAGATVCKLSNPKVSKMKCRKVDALWHSKFGQHVVDEKTTKAAMQLMCTFMKRGVLLDNPLGTGKGFTNLENMLKHPDAYPQLLLTKDNIVAAVTQILDQGKTLKRVFGVTDKDYKPIKDKTGKEIKYINNFGEKPHIVASEAAMLTRGLVLSYPPDKLKTEFLDKLQELRDIQNKQVQDHSCEMKAEASISLGLTIGESIVGFCTPDSNPFQAITTKKREWGQKNGEQKLRTRRWCVEAARVDLFFGIGIRHILHRLPPRRRHKGDGQPLGHANFGETWKLRLDHPAHAVSCCRNHPYILSQPFSYR